MNRGTQGKVVGFVSGLICSGFLFAYIQSTRVPPDAPLGPRMALEGGAIGREASLAPAGQPREPAGQPPSIGTTRPEASLSEEQKKAAFEEEQAAPHRARIEAMRKVPGAAPLVDDILASIDRELAEGREVFSDEDLPVDETGIPYLDEGGAARMIRNPEIREKMAKLNALLEKQEVEREPAAGAETTAAPGKKQSD
jgi:hypothetical protein